MIHYARTRLAGLLVAAIVRVLTPELLAQPRATTDAPAPRIPAPRPAPAPLVIPAQVRIARSVVTTRAMVQAANALSSASEDVPSSLRISASYPDGLLVVVGMDLMQMDGEEVEDE